MSYQKSKQAYCSYVAPEDIKLNTFYALTINPNDKFQFIKVKDRFEHFKKAFAELFYKKLATSEYKMYVEESNVGRLHLHGIIRFISWDEAQDFYNFLMKIKDTCTFMFSNEDEALSEEKKEKYKTWRIYMKKQLKYWKRLEQDSSIDGNRDNYYVADTKYDISTYF